MLHRTRARGSRLAPLIVRCVLAAAALLPLAVSAHAQSPLPNQGADTDATGSVLERRARLSIRDISLPDALIRLSERSGVPLSFSPTRLPSGLRVSCSCDGVSVRTALERLLRDSKLEFQERSGQILVFSPGPPTAARFRGAPTPAAKAETPSTPSHTAPPVEETGSLRVRVSDASTGKPVAGAIVSVPQADLVVGTSADGELLLDGLAVGEGHIRVQAFGYRVELASAPVRPNVVSAVEVELTREAVELEEIVAIGYGQARRRDLTGAILSVPGTDGVAARAPVSSISNTLLGRVAGVYVVSNLGTPGASATIRIRGPNSLAARVEPLYVVDGIPISPGESDLSEGTPLNVINPNNVESIQILKDASATAIYGARGANGVVLITTKRGKRGSNQVQVETSYGIQKPSRFIEVLDAREYRILANEADRNAGLTPRYTQAEIDGAQSFDYPRALLQNLAWQPQQSQTLTLSGGDERTRYLLSGSFMKQDGIVLNSGFQRYGARVNLDRTVSSRFRVGTSLSGTRAVQRVNGSVSEGTNADNTGLTVAMMFDPATPPRDSLGNWNKRVTSPVNVTNALAESTERRNPVFTTALLASVFGEYDLGAGLQLRSTVGGNFNFNRNPSYSPGSIVSGNEVGTARIASNERRELTNENTLTYRRAVGAGNLEVMAGASIQDSRLDSFSAEMRGFGVDELLYNDLGAGALAYPASSRVTRWTLLSQLGRVNYNLLDRYLFTVTARRDGSSRFGKNNKWALFPSAAFAWRLIDEPFMRDQRVFSEIKIRTSYGRTGNQAINPYQSLSRLQTRLIAFGTGANSVALVPVATAPNPNLRWETQDQLNLGVDLGFLDNRITLTADAYESRTSNLLLARNLSWETGYATQLQNVGAVRNRGVELSLSTLNWEGEHLRWTTQLNVSANRNEVTKLYGGLRNLGAGSSTQVGEPLSTFVGYRVLGLWQEGDSCPLLDSIECTPGEYRLLDANGDGVINDDDRVNLGNPQADFSGGFTNGLEYGPLSLDAFFNFSVGNRVYNNAQMLLGLVAGSTNEIRARALDRWTPEHTHTTVPRANADRVVSRTYSTQIENGSFLRLQAITLGYEIPTRLIPGGSVEGARLLVTGQNLWITTRYSGYDPEQQAMDFGGYPRARTWNVGLNVTF
jgi:TonB-linked SusC/RagA family outer membrane protein